MKTFHLLTFVFFSSLLSCQTPAGHSGISNNIDDSKKRNIFIAEYTVFPNPYKINDTIQLTVQEAWLEKQWSYGNSEIATIPSPLGGYQLCIKTTKKNILYVDETWTIGLDGDKYMRSSSENSLVGDFTSIPTDTIEYKVQKGTNLGRHSKKIIIGKIVLIKIRN